MDQRSHSLNLSTNHPDGGSRQQHQCPDPRQSQCLVGRDSTLPSNGLQCHSSLQALSRPIMEDNTPVPLVQSKRWGVVGNYTAGELQAGRGQIQAGVGGRLTTGLAVEPSFANELQPVE